MEKIKQTANYALSALKNSGAQKCAVHASFERCEEFNVDGGEFSLLRTVFNHSLSLVAYKDSKKGSININSHTPDDIDKAVADCICAAESGVEDSAYDIAPKIENGDFVSGVVEGDRDKLFERSRELLCDIKKNFPTIIIEQMIVSYNFSKDVYMNSNGVQFTDVGGVYVLSLMFSAHEGDISSSFCCADITCDNLDTPFIAMGDVKDQLESATKQVHTKAVEGKFVGTMLLPPQNLNSFMQMILGNFVCDGSLIDSTSLWKDSLETQVADERITLSASPFDSRIVCGEHYTGDGFKSENCDIIKNGVLKNFKLSLYGSNKTGLPRGKNSSWALIFKEGDTPLDDLIKGIDKGILVGRFSGGNPGVNGEFSGVAKNSFLIENGKITDAVSETMISGNLADMLKNLKGISKETVCDGSCVMPYAAFDGITVSGK